MEYIKPQLIVITLLLGWCPSLINADIDAKYLHTVAPNGKIYGVNIGGWLILENFIVTSVFESTKNPSIIDEWTFCSLQSDWNQVDDMLHAHWDSWFTDGDLAQLEATGITHLRIPIGHWGILTQEELHAHNEPYHTGSWIYMLKAIRWSKQRGIKVIIDLHTAPGSQNGWDHSGRTGTVGWGKGDTINRTLAILDRLSNNIQQLENDSATSGTVVGLSLLNEPFPPLIHGGVALVKNFFQEAYRVVRQHLSADRYAVIITESFDPRAFSSFMSPPEYENVWMDYHNYHCFDDYLRSLPYPQQINLTCTIDKGSIQRNALPTFVGEWSVAWKMESIVAQTEQFPDPDQQEFMKKYALAQLQAYESAPAVGQFFWNFKTEHAPMWNYLLGVANGWLPCRFPMENPENACIYVDPSVRLAVNNCSMLKETSSLNGTIPTTTDTQSTSSTADSQSSNSSTSVPPTAPTSDPSTATHHRREETKPTRPLETIATTPAPFPPLPATTGEPATVQPLPTRASNEPTSYSVALLYMPSLVIVAALCVHFFSL